MSDRFNVEPGSTALVLRELLVAMLPHLPLAVRLAARQRVDEMMADEDVEPASALRQAALAIDVIMKRYGV
jgi:hypothetical protein